MEDLIDDLLKGKMPEEKPENPLLALIKKYLDIIRSIRAGR